MCIITVLAALDPRVIFPGAAEPNPPKLSVPWRGGSETTTLLSGRSAAVRPASGFGNRFLIEGRAASVEVTAFFKVV